VTDARGCITISIASHRHAALVSSLLTQLADFPEIGKVIVTVNVPDAPSLAPPALRDRVLLVENAAPAGFGANHNAALVHCDTEYFCVLNPDIAFVDNPFPRLLDALNASTLAFAAPLIVNPGGGVEDSARHFPTPLSLLLRLARLRDGRFPVTGTATVRPDWIAGMFMLFRADAFRAIGGFDERFFLYCEDMDICARLRHAGADFALCPAVRVVHDARRSSHKSLRYLRMHIASLLRFFVHHWGRLPARSA
jgi:GT2 family glycosyltransferase